MAWIGRELKAQPVPAPSVDTHQLRLLRDPSNLTLSTSRDGGSTASLSSCARASLLTVNNLFLISNLSLPYLGLQPLSFVLSIHTVACKKKKTFSSFHVAPRYVLEGHSEVSPAPSLLQAEQTQLPQPLFTELLQHSEHPHILSLDSFQEVHGLLMA